MKYLVAVACVLGCFAWAHGMTTTHPHHEHSEADNFGFYYDGASQMMLVMNTQTCYIWPITADEMSMVHTDDGMRSIELRVFKEIDAAYYTRLPQNVIASTILRGCRSSTHHHTAGGLSYYLVH